MIALLCAVFLARPPDPRGPAMPAGGPGAGDDDEGDFPAQKPPQEPIPVKEAAPPIAHPPQFAPLLPATDPVTNADGAATRFAAIIFTALCATALLAGIFRLVRKRRRVSMLPGESLLIPVRGYLS
jgi:hypothetical protein